MQQSQKQAIRIRRSLLANMGLLLNIFFCVLATSLGYFIIDVPQVALITSVMWLGHACLVLLIFFKVNLRFKDASLTVPQMLWVISFISLLMFFVNDIRPFILMSYLMVMVFGGFRLTARGVYGVTLYTLATYFVSIVCIYASRANEVAIVEELFIFAGFTIVLIGFAFLENEFSNLRRDLGARHQDLKHAFNRIEEIAITDELTGLYNRRHLLHMLRAQRALANRSRYRFVVCYLDLDYFKKVNDEFGHGFGDKVLKSFAQLMTDSLRDVDFAARLGGEEFVLVLADTSMETAYGVCKRMADKWQQHYFPMAPELSLTLSAGITEFRVPETIETTLERADQLLYQAKHKGRNLIVMDAQEHQVTFDFEQQSH